MHYRISFIFVGHKMLTQTNLQSLLFYIQEHPKNMK